MDLSLWLEKRGGIAHAHEARRAGFTPYRIRAWVDSGQVRRIRRTWLATADASDALSAAARLGGRLSCLSAAAHLGLWHMGDGKLHLSVPANAGRVAAGGNRLHWGGGPLAVSPFALIEPIENVLAHVAACQSFENALVVWESALNKGLVSVDYLARLPFRSAPAKLLLAACSMRSDSGIESLPVTRLALLGIEMRQQVVVDGHRVDGLIGARLVLQIDGFTFHSDPAQRRRDIAEDRRLVLRGYTVLRYDYRQIMFEWDTVEAEILAAMAQGLHLA